MIALVYNNKCNCQQTAEDVDKDNLEAELIRLKGELKTAELRLDQEKYNLQMKYKDNEEQMENFNLLNDRLSILMATIRQLSFDSNSNYTNANEEFQKKKLLFLSHQDNIDDDLTELDKLFEGVEVK